MSWRSRIMNVFRSARVERELDEEQRFHLDARIEALMRRDGLSRRDAEAVAMRAFGSPLRARESSRDVKLSTWLESLLKDMRFGIRLLRKDAVVSGAAIASLALAIGACAAAFSLIDALILRPLPVREPERLVYLTYPLGDPQGSFGESFSFPFFVGMREVGRPHVSLFLMSSQTRQAAIFADANGQDEQVRTQFVSGDAFGILGLTPATGRLIAPADDEKPGVSAVAVLSHAFWQRRFGGNPDVVGRTFTFRQRQYQIIGVANAGFTGVEPGMLTDLWVPSMMYNPRAFAERQFNWFKIWGRLQPDATPERVEAVLRTTFMRLRAEVPFRPGTPADRIERFRNTPVFVRSAANGPSALRKTFERPLWILAIVVSLVLLIASSNVANLLIARAAARERELSLRLSIGAGRARLVQQVLVESGLLAAAACMLGVIVAAVAAPIIVRLLTPVTDPTYLELHVSWRLIAFTAGLGLLATMVFGLAPALRASRIPAMEVLRAGGRAHTSRHAFGALVATQVGFSLVVLFVAGLLLLSFGKLTRVDAGFTPRNLLLVGIQPREASSGGTPEQQQQQQQAAAVQLLDRVRQMPGVEQAGMTGFTIFGDGGWTQRVPIPGREPQDVETTMVPVSPGFVETMRLRVLEGRTFTPADTEPVRVVVNESFARQMFGTTRVVGRIFSRFNGRDAMVTQDIIGVVSDAKYDNVRQPAPPIIYPPLRGLGTLYIRTTSDPLAIAPLLRSEIERSAPSLRVGDMTLQSTLITNTLLRERLLALLSGFFAIVGLLLAAVGLYGVLSYAVVQRTREIGIRVALGARPAGVMRTVLVRIVWTIAIGIAAGLAGGLFLSRFVTTLLFDVEPLDATSLAMPVVALLMAAALAAVPPARRAARVDPVVALRYE